MTRRWFRLDVEWYSSDWIAPMHGLAQLAWVRLLGHVKQNGSMGRSKALTPTAAGLLWRIPAKHVATMLEAAQGDGALTIEGGEWVLTKWVEYQEVDATASERMRRYREKQGVAHGKPSNGADNASVTAVTRNLPVTRHATVDVEPDVEPDSDSKTLPTTKPQEASLKNGSHQPPASKSTASPPPPGLDALIKYVGERHRTTVETVAQLPGATASWARGLLAQYGPGELLDLEVNAIPESRRPRVLAIALQRVGTDSDRWTAPFFRKVLLQAAKEAGERRGPPVSERPTRQPDGAPSPGAAEAVDAREQDELAEAAAALEEWFVGLDPPGQQVVEADLKARLATLSRLQPAGRKMPDLMREGTRMQVLREWRAKTHEPRRVG